MLRHDCIDTISMPVADSGASHSWKSWIKAGYTLLVSDMARVVKTLVKWQRREIWRARLSDFDERMLKDIGLTREQAMLEVRKPFWRA